MSPTTKYWVLVALGAISATLTYILGQPAVTESVVIAGVILGVTFAFHDIEQATPETTPPS